MLKTKIARGVMLAVAGSALSLGMASAANAHVMYNTFTTSAPTETDGWTRVYDGTDADSVATGPESNGNQGAYVPWLGVANQPFGYNGSSHLNWAVEIHGLGDSHTVSAADAAAEYGGAVVEIDTGAGAWQDNGLDGSGNPTALGPTGWKHQTDIGLIMSEVTQFVTLNLSTLGTVNNNFGVTVFTGMDTNTGNYSHHGSWNNSGKPFTTSNPFGTQGVQYLTHDATVDSSNGISFVALAGQVYSIYLGGNGVGRWNANVAGYELNITTAPVPVPAAVWLFGSALLGLGAKVRRRVA